MTDIIKNSINVGLSGSFAMITQVSTLMWLRTIMNYQYVNGTTFKVSFKKLYSEGGILRLYRGYPLALTIGPISRFGDTACNSAILQLTKDSNLPLSIKTGLASVSAGLWRILILPLDAVKVNYQVNGSLNTLRSKIKANGFRTLYNGGIAQSSATIIGHYPWFVTYNYLNNYFPSKEIDTKLERLGRAGSIGLASSIVSDTVSNSVRVLKIYKQTDKNNLTYSQIVNHLYKKEGIVWIFRGLKTKIFTNGLNSIMFSISWKYFQDKLK